MSVFFLNGPLRSTRDKIPMLSASNLKVSLDSMLICFYFSPFFGEQNIMRAPLNCPEIYVISFSLSLSLYLEIDQCVPILFHLTISLPLARSLSCSLSLSLNHSSTHRLSYLCKLNSSVFRTVII